MTKEKLFRNNYSNCSTEDLLADESFLTWVKYGKEYENLDLYWNIIIKNNPGIKKQVEQAIKIIKVLAPEKKVPDQETENHVWRKIQSGISKTGHIRVINISRHYILKYKNVAAILLIALLMAGASWEGYQLKNATSTDISEYFTTIYSPAGYKTELTLPDNSRVWLNSESTLKYSNRFNVNNRNVYLNGEAFFDVEKSNTPFEVNTNAMKIKVVGTEFNIKCYSDEDIAEATLVTGKMMVEKLNVMGGNEQVVLQPNQKIVVKKDTGKTTDIEPSAKSGDEKSENEIKTLMEPVEQVELVESYDTKKSTGWVDGLLIIESESLLELSRKIERRYNVKFVFMNDDLKEYKYTGTLKEYSLEQVLNAIEFTSPVKYRVDKQIVYIGENSEVISKYMELLKRMQP